MRTLFAWKFSGKVWYLDEMLEIFRCEIETKDQASLTEKAEKRNIAGALYPASKLSNYHPSSRNPASGSRKNNKSCLFCQGNHPLFHCTKVTDQKIRKVLIFKNRLCFICFDNLHTLQNVPQVTVVKNPKVVTTFRFVQKILRMIIKAATEVKIVDTVKIKTHIKMIIKNNYICE